MVRDFFNRLICAWKGHDYKHPKWEVRYCQINLEQHIRCRCNRCGQVVTIKIPIEEVLGLKKPIIMRNYYYIQEG